MYHKLFTYRTGSVALGVNGQLGHLPEGDIVGGPWSKLEQKRDLAAHAANK